MKKKSRSKFLAAYALCFLLFSCIEPYELKEEANFDNRLVVEAVLTDEFKFHQIELSRTRLLNEFDPQVEENATIRVVEDDVVSYEFEEKKPGKYFSKIKFKAIQEKSYKLEITLKSGKKYISSVEKLPSGIANDFEVAASKSINKEGINGVEISYANISNGNKSIDDLSYFRFDYLGTYKIVPQYWSDNELIVNSTPKPLIFPKNHTKGKVCYGQDESDKIILRKSSDFQGAVVEPFEVHFLEELDPKIFIRYSMEIRQYLISREAFAFYNTLKDISETENVFSENQPGNIIGNIIALNNNSERVIGFFDVSKVQSKRVFFNSADFFIIDGSIPDFERYVQPCFVTKPSLLGRGKFSKQPFSLNEMLQKKLVEYVIENDPPREIGDGPYVVVTKNCGDCSALGSTIKPDFWID